MYCLQQVGGPELGFLICHLWSYPVAASITLKLGWEVESAPAQMVHVCTSLGIISTPPQEAGLEAEQTSPHCRYSTHSSKEILFHQEMGFLFVTCYTSVSVGDRLCVVRWHDDRRVPTLYSRWHHSSMMYVPMRRWYSLGSRTQQACFWCACLVIRNLSRNDIPRQKEGKKQLIWEYYSKLWCYFVVSFLVFPGQGWFRSVRLNAGIWKSLGSVKNHVIAVSGVSCVWAALDFVGRQPFPAPERREVVDCDQLWPWQVPWRKNFSLFTSCKFIFPDSTLKCSLRQNHCLKPIAKVSRDHTAGLPKGSGREPHVFFQGSQVTLQANIYRGFSF